MIRKILFCLTVAVGVLSLRAADGDWRIHQAVDADYKMIFDAPDRVYILAYGQPYAPEDQFYANEKVQLFVLDKSSGEVLGYTRRNYLSSSMIATGQYNARGGYLCLVYTDGNMDLIYDNGKISNIPALKNATITESKTVNAITFGLDDNKIYMATDFGFVVIDPSSSRIEKARNYHKQFGGIARVGDKLVLTDKDYAYIADYNSPLQSINEFHCDTSQEQAYVLILPLSGNRILASRTWSVDIMEINASDELTNVQQLVNDLSLKYYSTNRQGYLLSGSWSLLSSSYDGTATASGSYTGDASYYNRHVTSADYKNFYVADGRKGVAHFNNKEGKIGWDVTWTLLGHIARPNASAVFSAAYMTYSDKYGMLVSNPSHTNYFPSQRAVPTGLSGLKNGVWDMYGYAYTNPVYESCHYLAKGITPDPVNPDILYSGSRNEGLMIMNLADPKDVKILGVDGAAASSLPGFVKIKEQGSASSPIYFNLSTPYFDASGNLWSYHHNVYDTHGEGDLWVWPATSLRNKDYTGYVTLNSGAVSGVYGELLPLRASSNRNLVLINNGRYGEGLALIDHNGTLDNTSDDRKILISSLMNQDGGVISYDYAYCMYEDVNTGTVWVGTNNGIFTIQPWQLFDNPSQGRRVKVARNDGTNLADYLLDGVMVHSICPDGNGNLWFGTIGAGIVQTSSDGTHVIRQLTAENSYLPSSDAYTVCYNKGNNSIMAATTDGIAEYFVPGAATGENFDNVKIYPNPVRPDFIGYITIEGLHDNSLVKIVDSEGNLVKELGCPLNGSVQWDGTNITGAMVNSGVYFVFMSRSGENATEANVGKIVVVK